MQMVQKTTWHFLQWRFSPIYKLGHRWKIYFILHLKRETFKTATLLIKPLLIDASFVDTHLKNNPMEDLNHNVFRPLLYFNRFLRKILAEIWKQISRCYCFAIGSPRLTVATWCMTKRVVDREGWSPRAEHRVTSTSHKSVCKGRGSLYSHKRRPSRTTGSIGLAR